MSDMQWDSPRETELSLQGARRAVTPAVKGAGVWVRGLASEIRGWGAGCVPRALEVQDLPVCEVRGCSGATCPHRCMLRKERSREVCRQGSSERFQGRGARSIPEGCPWSWVELLLGGCGASHSACSCRRGPQLCPEPAQTPTPPRERGHWADPLEPIGQVMASSRPHPVMFLCPPHSMSPHLSGGAACGLLGSVGAPLSLDLLQRH